ncbi:MAG: iron-containing alcohol dehydrogenase, partial [Thermoleophilaceae bacterium]|nr:iron-containing alcohol dehydrogenase [Thermoleophilaceae bacterium]
REWVALGALLGGWAVAVTGLMLHHAMAQTLVRSSGAAHAAVNVALLPATIERLELTQPTEMAWLSDGLVRSLPALAVQLRANAAITGLDDLGISHDHLTAAAATVVERSDFAYLAPDTTRAQLEQLYERAF